MGEKFCPCRTTIQLWEYGKKDHVYNKYGRKYPFEFSKGDEAGSVPEWRCAAESAVPADQGII